MKQLVKTVACISALLAVRREMTVKELRLRYKVNRDTAKKNALEIVIIGTSIACHELI